jgi:tetratricopeptide (TPR) repeat protein
VAAIEAEEKVRALEAKEQEVRAEEDKQVRLAEQMRPANGLSSSGEKKEQPRKVDPIDSDPTVQKLRERLERLPALESRVRTSDELEAEVYILLMRGNVLMSAGLDADALISFWAAKTALDRLLALRASGPSANVPHSTQLCLDALSSAQLAPDMERKDQMHHPHLADPHPVSSLVYRQLGCACAHLQQWNLALQCFSAAKTMCFQSLSEETFEFIDTATALNNMAVCLFHLGRFRSSHFYLEAALELLQQRLQSVHPRVSIVVANLERVRQWRSTLPLEMTPPERAAQQGKPKPRKFRVRMNPLEKAMTLLRESVDKKSKKQKKKGGKSGAKKK